MPTYNYVNPAPVSALIQPFGVIDFVSGTMGHGLLDVIPYVFGGNVRGEN
ncbi:hypothetical protein [Leucothrix pacifica]|nr:hypothetical protein [Leucothrix pacifica]